MYKNEKRGDEVKRFEGKGVFRRQKMEIYEV